MVKKRTAMIEVRILLVGAGFLEAEENMPRTSQMPKMLRIEEVVVSKVGSDPSPLYRGKGLALLNLNC